VSVAGRLAFPAPSVAFRRCRPDLRGIPFTATALQPKSPRIGPHDLVVSSRALTQELESPLGDSSSRGVCSKPVCPPADMPLARPLPGTEAPFGPTELPAESRSAYVVSHHHDGLLHAKVTGLLHPATGQGFAAFRASRAQRHQKATQELAATPRDAVHTLRRLSLASSRTASLRPLPSCRYRPPPDTPPRRGVMWCVPSRPRPRGSDRAGGPPKRAHRPPTRQVRRLHPEGNRRPAPLRGRRAAEARGRSDPVKLRSAEADPHVTERFATAKPKPGATHAKTAVCRCRSTAETSDRAEHQEGLPPGERRGEGSPRRPRALGSARRCRSSGHSP